jgi:RNA polymerase sigma-70 factor (ECF subfamily)
MGADSTGTERGDQDRRIIENYLAGREAEFRLVEDWIGREIDLRYARLRDEREDLCQQVHEKLVGNLRAGRFRSESAFRTYVISVVHYTCIDMLRSRFLRPSGALLDDYPAAWGNPYREALARDARQILHRILHASPEICRRLWRMIFVDRLHYREIGGLLGIPAGTVKSRMHGCRQRALAIFRRLAGAPPG